MVELNLRGVHDQIIALPQLKAVVKIVERDREILRHTAHLLEGAALRHHACSGDGAQVIYLDEEDKIKAQIEEADKMADVVVVSCHYGTEIQNELNKQQTEITPKLVEWGADLIIGTQAHTISTCGYLDKPEGGQAFVYYGLGNFISTMYDTKSLVGLIGKLNVVKDPDTNEVTFENVKAIPIISHFEGDSYYGDWYNCTVYPYAEYTDELFAKNYVEGFTRESVKQCLSYIPDEFLSIE